MSCRAVPATKHPWHVTPHEKAQVGGSRAGQWPEWVWCRGEGARTAMAKRVRLGGGGGGAGGARPAGSGQETGAEGAERGRKKRARVSAQEGAATVSVSAGRATQVAAAASGGAAGVVRVQREEGVQSARLALPVAEFETEIVEAVRENDVLLLCGETGSGKSTQVPQFCYEAGMARTGMIAVTQPRRVAAMSTAKRVAMELGESVMAASGGRGGAGTVGYRVRYDSSHVGDNTKVVFMTDGILLREITQDILLRKYSVVFLDEAHERNLNTDVLLGLLTRAIPLRRRIIEAKAGGGGGAFAQVDIPGGLQPLKLVIMSATLRVEDFLENRTLFPTAVPRLISVQARQHPVTVHFNRRTELHDYMSATFHKVCKIHRRLPAGGILVFLTGKREVLHMCRLLRQEFNSKRGRNKHKSDADDAATRFRVPVDEETRKDEEDASSARARRGGGGIAEEDVDDYEDDSSNDGDEATTWFDDNDTEQRVRNVDGLDSTAAAEAASAGKTNVGDGPGDEDDAEEEEEAETVQLSGEAVFRAGISVSRPELRGSEAEQQGTQGVEPEQTKLAADADAAAAGNEDLMEHCGGRVLALPLYAMLSPGQQSRVFDPPPEGSRLIVVATNVAETSITIPGIKYVVDCGRVKRRVIRQPSGISSFDVHWISQASADQRAGRAGRTSAGHAYRLYSSNVYNTLLDKFDQPEIRTRPLEDVLLQLLAMGISHVGRFPFPSPPPHNALTAATKLLHNLGAVLVSDQPQRQQQSQAQDAVPPFRATDLGLDMARIPVGVRFAKMLLIGRERGRVPLGHILTLVAAMAERDPRIVDGEDADDGQGDSKVSKTQKKKEKQQQKNEAASQQGDVSGAAFSSSVAAVAAVADQTKDSKTTTSSKWLRKKNESSDAIVRMKLLHRILQFGHDPPAIHAYCLKHNLHETTVWRSIKLRRLLHRIVSQVWSLPTDDSDDDDGDDDDDETGEEEAEAEERGRGRARRKAAAGNVGAQPTPDECTELRKLILAGFVDHVARVGSASMVPSGSRFERTCVYQCGSLSLSGPLYVHASSVLFTKRADSLTDWVCFQDVLRNVGGRDCMTCVTAVQPGWFEEMLEDMPMMRWAAPLETPAPVYNQAVDGVECVTAPRFGDHGWELPSTRRPWARLCEELLPRSDPSAAPPADAEYRWFARLWLEGKITPLGSAWANLFRAGGLMELPAVLTRRAASRRAVVLVSSLQQRGVRSVASLFDTLTQNESWLKPAMLAWFKPQMHMQFRSAWQSMLALAQASAANERPTT